MAQKERSAMTVQARTEAAGTSAWRDYVEARRRMPDVPEVPNATASRIQSFLSSRWKPGQKERAVYLKAAARRRSMQHEQIKIGASPGGAGSVNWTPIGPSVIYTSWLPQGVSGRVNSFAIGPAGNRVYAGAANGGVWFSADGGNNWIPLNDYIVSPSVVGGGPDADALSIGALTVHFGAYAAADELFVGTGEPNGNYDAYMGIGVRHLVGGAWSLEATNLAGHGIYAVVIDPNDAAAPTPATDVYVATTGGLFKRPTAGSVASWNQVISAAFTNGNAAVSDFIAAGTGGTRTFYAAFYGDRVYSSPDGVAWTALTGLTAPANTRIALAASESLPGVIYALLGNGAIYRLSGTTFYPVTGLPTAVLFAEGQGWYDIAIAVSPTDPNTILVGGDAYAVYKGTITGTPGSFVFPFNAANAGQPWMDPTWVGQGIHSDVHAITFGLNAAGTAHDPNNVWVGSDGGNFHSAMGGAAGSFQARNLGVAITEFAYLAQRADTDAVVFAGAQDNGTPRLLSEQAGQDMAGGDGGGVAFDPASPYRVMRQYVHAYLNATTDGGATWTGLTFPPAGQPEGGASGFVAPIRAAAGGGVSRVAFGTNRLWVSDDWGTTWVTLPTGTNPYAAMPPNTTQDVIDGTPVRAIAFTSPSRIFAATWSTIWRYDLAGAVWSKTALPNTGLPGFVYFTAIAPDLDPAANPGSLYATFGFSGTAHCYYFDGTSWHAAMPTTVVDVPTHAVVVDPVTPTKVYVGTDVGCFQGNKTGPTTWSWILFSQGLPESAITDLGIFAAAAPARLLRAATHGRGVWEIDLSATTGLDPDIYLRVNYADDGRLTAAGSRYPWTEGSADPTHVGYTLYHWMSADVKVRRSSLMGLPPLASPVNYLDYAANIGDYVDTSWHSETGDLTGTDRLFVEVHNRSLNAVPAAQVHVLLLRADASAGLPNLPAGWAAHVNALDTSPAWLVGSGFAFVDPVIPYRTPNADVDVRTPQVVEYQLDFGSLGLPAGHDHVCLAAFVTTPADSITSALTDLNQVTMTDKHVAHRNVHLVAAGVKPITQEGPFPPIPKTFLVDFHNPEDHEVRVDLVFDRQHFNGHLSVILPKLPELAHPDRSLDGFRMKKRSALAIAIRDAVGDWLERTGERLEALGSAIEDELDENSREEVERRSSKFRSLDPTHVYVAQPDALAPAFTGIRIPAGKPITAAVTIQAPAESRPGDRFRLDVLQRSGAALVGGSTYVLVVTIETKHGMG